MTRIEDPDSDSLSEPIRQILDALPDLGLFRQLSHAPEILPQWLAMGGALLSKLSLPPAIRELIILQVSASTRCQYEEIQHVAIARQIGIEENKIDAVVSQRLDDPSIRGEGPGLAAIDRLIKNHHLSDAEFASLRVAFSDRQIIEVLVLVGWYQAIALLAGAIDLTPDLSVDLAVVDAATSFREDNL